MTMTKTHHGGCCLQMILYYVIRLETT